MEGLDGGKRVLDGGWRTMPGWRMLGWRDGGWMEGWRAGVWKEGCWMEGAGGFWMEGV